MTPLTYEILLALADGERHGYGVIKELESRFGADAAPSTGALYLALRRMEQDGLIAEAEVAASGEDARRRYYRLTATGRAAAVAESVRLAELLKAARAKHLLPGRVDA